MLLSLIKYTRGYVYVRLTGYAPERFLNLCGNRGILIWNLKPCEEGYEFCISINGFRRLKPILKKTKTKIHILKRKGLPFELYRYRKRKLFAVGLVCLCGLIYYLSGFIWNIEVNGNSYLSEEVVLDFLSEEESSFGSRKKDISCAKLEEHLRSRYGEVIWTSIKIYGTKMTVDIQENLLPEESYDETDETVYDITAEADGIVREMITRSGTPLVAVGSEVKTGDCLVSACVELLNDDGEVYEYLYEGADADITAEVVLPYEDVIPTDYVDTVYTGNTAVTYELRFLDTVITNPFFKNKFAEWNQLADTTQFHFTDNFYLPIYFTTRTYYEYESVEKTHTKEEIQTIAQKNLTNYLTELEEKGIQIIGKDVIIEKKNRKYVAKGTITVLQSIVSKHPAEVREITLEERQLTDESD